MMLVRKISRGYKVMKTHTDEGPLPRMLQYYLHNDNGQKISFWNDVPISLEGDSVNCGIEIPKQLHGKFEVKKNMPFHPFMQDTRKNLFTKELELRYYAQFPLFNYGFIPQTWEQNLVKDERGYFGDDDPIDICDLSQKQKFPGEIYLGKVLGSFCLIDQDETDWKILMIDQAESQANNINSIDDIDPRRIQSIKKWFIGIKTYDGKKANTIAYDQKTFSKKETIEIIRQTHQSWKQLVSKDDPRYEEIRSNYHIKKMQFH